MSKIGVKLASFSAFKKGGIVKMKYVVVSTLEELCVKGAVAHGFNNDCEIVTECGTVIADDEALFFLYKEVPLYVTTKLDGTADIPQTDDSSSPIHSDGTEFTHEGSNILLSPGDSVSIDGSINQLEFMEVQLVTSANENNQTPPAVNVVAVDATTTLRFYPVDEILVKLREKVRGDLADSAQQLMERLLECEVCSNRDRLLVKKATGNWLMANCESKEQYPTAEEFLKMAKSIVHYYPSTGNKCSKSPWDFFYDGKTHKGPLESFVRSKRFRLNVSSSSQSKKRRLALDTVIPTAEEILIAEKYMREEVLNSKDQRNNNREEMLAKFVLTRPSRREFIEKGNNAATTILNRYRRLKDMKEAIEDEFKFLKNSTPVAFVESWKSVEKKVVTRGKETLTRSPEAKAILEKLEKAEENYDSVAFTSLAFELLLHLLPNKTAKGKRTRTPTAESWPALFQNFDRIILPVAAVSEATMMRLPGVLNINGQYFIKVDEGAIKLPSNVSTITLAFAYLTMYYYILNLNYPDALKNVFLFFEKLLQIEPSIFSQDVHVLYSLVSLTKNDDVE